MEPKARPGIGWDLVCKLLLLKALMATEPVRRR